MGFPGGSEVKVSACNAGDPGSIPGSGRSPGEGNGNPLQDSCLGNPMDREAWWATVHGAAESDMMVCFQMKLLSAMTVLRFGVQILCCFKILKKLTSEKNRILREFILFFFFLKHLSCY